MLYLVGVHRTDKIPALMKHILVGEADNNIINKIYRVEGGKCCEERVRQGKRTFWLQC